MKFGQRGPLDCQRFGGQIVEFRVTPVTHALRNLAPGHGGVGKPFRVAARVSSEGAVVVLELTNQWCHRVLGLRVAPSG